MVKIVGAGPGAKDLITVRGMKLLNEADVIIYAGSLVNEELLEYAKESCEIYNSAYMNLDEVIDVIVKAENEGKKVVRLHTGDPSLYGAIREQIEELAKHGIACEVCPGVAAFLQRQQLCSVNIQFQQYHSQLLSQGCQEERQYQTMRI